MLSSQSDLQGDKTEPAERESEGYALWYGVIPAAAGVCSDVRAAIILRGRLKCRAGRGDGEAYPQNGSGRLPAARKNLKYVRSDWHEQQRGHPPYLQKIHKNVYAGSCTPSFLLSSPLETDRSAAGHFRGFPS